MRKILSLIILFSTILYAQTIDTVIVDPGGTGEYTSLSTALSTEQTDLQAANKSIVFLIKNTNNTTITYYNNIDGAWNTNATHTLKIVSHPDYRHTGRIGETNVVKFLRGSRSFGVYTNYVTFEGLVLGQNNTLSTSTNNEAPITLNWAQEAYEKGLTIVKDCVFYRQPGGNTDFSARQCGLVLGGRANADSIVYIVRNNIFYDFKDVTSNSVYGVGLYFSTADSDGRHAWYVYNNTFVNCNIGIEVPTSGNTRAYLKNNISVDMTTYNYYGAFQSESTNNLTDNSTYIGSNYITNANVVFEDEANDVFLLDEADADAKGAGVDLSSDSAAPFNDDILGNIRTIWDIGAHNVSVGGLKRKLFIF